jgi:hypothetical protein
MTIKMRHAKSWLLAAQSVAAIALLLATILVAPADRTYAGDKSQCVADCAQRGSSLQSCGAQCGVTALDQRCLRDCIAAGNLGTVCRPSCSYVEPDALTLPKTAAGDNAHAQFSSIVPVPPNVVMLDNAPPQTDLGKTPAPSKAAKALMGPSTNYKCVASCRQLGYGADYCAQRCQQSPLH